MVNRNLVYIRSKDDYRLKFRGESRVGELLVSRSAQQRQGGRS